MTSFEAFAAGVPVVSAPSKVSVLQLAAGQASALTYRNKGYSRMSPSETVRFLVAGKNISFGRAASFHRAREQNKQMSPTL